MEALENNEVSIVKKIEGKLDNLEKASNIKEALALLRGVESELKGYKLFLSINKEKNNLYVIGEGKGDKILLNIPLKISDINGLSSMLNDIKKLLNYDGEIQIIGGKEWRSIATVQSFGGDSLAKRLIYKGLPHGNDIDFYINENNKLEELFVFIQKLKGVPENDWIINKRIKETAPLGNTRPPIIKKEEN